MICCDCTNNLPPDDFPMIADLSRKSKRCLPCTRELRAKESTARYRKDNWTNRHNAFGYIPLHDKLQRPRNRLSKKDRQILRGTFKHDTDE